MRSEGVLRRVYIYTYLRVTPTFSRAENISDTWRGSSPVIASDSVCAVLRERERRRIFSRCSEVREYGSVVIYMSRLAKAARLM